MANKVSSERTVPRLEDYHVSEKYAFLVQDPLTRLPEYYQPWMTIADNLEASISDGTIRELIHAMPLLDHTRLTGHKQRRLAHLILSCLTQGYVWVDGDEGIPEILPKQLAVPFAGVSERNLDAIIRLPGGSDSVWFFMVYVATEIACGQGLGAIIEAQQAVNKNDVEMLELALHNIETSLLRMKTVMSRMQEKCAPEIFFNKLRPFLAGWDSAAFQRKGLEGLIYEGVSATPKRLVGGTAAQSSTLPSFDAALGVQPPPNEKRLLDTFRDYMPPAHRDFIDAIRNGPSIKSYVTNSEIESLHTLYDRCIKALEQFRSYHIQLAARYIVAMANKKSTNEKSTSPPLAGTGGTGFMEFLKNLRDNTKSSALSS